MDLNFFFKKFENMEMPTGFKYKEFTLEQFENSKEKKNMLII